MTRLVPALFAALVVSAALALHALDELPAPSVAVVAVAGGAAVLLAALVLVLRCDARHARAFAATLASCGLAALVIGNGALRAHSALAARLAPALEGVDLILVGVVDEMPGDAQRGIRLRLRVESCERLDDGNACALPARVELFRFGRYGESFRPAQRWRMQARLRRPHAPVNPFAFDRELRWLEEGIGATGSIRGTPVLLDERVLAAGPMLERLRARVRAALLASFASPPPREAGVLVALAIGDQNAIAPPLWEIFNRTGVSHLMSISGLHITMLAALAGWFADRLWRTRPIARAGLPLRIPAARLRLPAAVAAAGAYSLLAGWGVPAQRTFWMLSVAALLIGCGRSVSLPMAVGVAAAAITLLDPGAPLAAGFWLSFGAVLAIVWASLAVRPGERGLRRVLLSAVRTQWAATLALLPLGAVFFGSTSIVGPLANAFAIPLVSAIVTPAVLAAAALALVSPTLGGWLLVPLSWLVHVLLATLEALAQWPDAVVTIARPSAAVLVLAVGGAAFALAPRGLPGRALGAAALAPLLAFRSASPPANEIWLTVLDVGQGSAVLIETAAGRLLFDTGPGYGAAGDAGRRIVMPYLRARGITRIDAIVVSHEDDDHAGGARSLIALARPQWVASPLPYDHAVARAAPLHVNCRRGEGFLWGEVEFTWLHPGAVRDSAERSRSNASSCVLAVRSRAGRILLTGDIEAAQERAILREHGVAALHSDVLVAPHHGSATSSSAEFLDAVGASYAIFQVGYRNRFGHPSPRVLARYAQRGVVVLRSDRHGAIGIRLRADAPPVVSRLRVDAPPWWRVRVDDD